MPSVFLEDMHRIVNRKEICNFGLKEVPECFLIATSLQQLLLAQHRDIRHEFNKLSLIVEVLPCLSKRHPMILLCLLFGAYLKALPICSQVHIWISNNMLSILHPTIFTKSSSSLQSK